jgi:hypothetical protein
VTAGFKAALEEFFRGHFLAFALVVAGLILFLILWSNCLFKEMEAEWKKIKK